jgi:hypothetical protein
VLGWKSDTFIVVGEAPTAGMGGDVQFIHPDGRAAALQGRADLVVMLGRLGALGLTSKRLQKFSSTARDGFRSALCLARCMNSASVIDEIAKAIKRQAPPSMVGDCSANHCLGKAACCSCVDM